MISIKQACNVSIGYSDHVQNNFACYAAVALGAEIIEKHFTLDKTMEGPDHSSSLNPEEFLELINGIRKLESSLGSSVKRPTIAELENTFGMKRSIVLLKDVPVGTVITENIIGFKRPANGLSVNMLETIIGKELIRPMLKDESLQFNSIKW
jgi:N-acetylneuraminate synthase/N,N'-diacetyllegionaminate synthase